MRSRKNHLPRKSSPAGIKARQELRLKAFDGLPANIARGYHQPGSGNPRKLGRS